MTESNWEFSQLRTALSLLDPSITNIDYKVAALNAQINTVIVPITVADVEKIIVPTGELFQIYVLSNRPVTGSEMDQLIGAAWSFTKMLDKWTEIEPNNENVWVGVQLTLAGLHAAGVLSQQSIDAIAALRTVQKPVWNPPVTVFDVLALGLQ